MLLRPMAIRPHSSTRSMPEKMTHGVAGEAIEATGAALMHRATSAGRALLLFVDAMGQLKQVRSVLPSLVRQIERIGFGSLLVLALIAGLTGAIMAVQTGTELKKFGVIDSLGALIGATFCREMGPLWTAIIVMARSGSSMTAELGTMVVNEEVDALRVMNINPVRYLVLPRILALVISMPLLTAVADYVGILGGAIVAHGMFDLAFAAFKDSATNFLTGLDFWSGIVKSMVFACIIGTIACDRGLSTNDGAEGVGRATTTTVVLCVIYVLLANFLMTSFIQILIAPMVHG